MLELLKSRPYVYSVKVVNRRPLAGQGLLWARQMLAIFLILTTLCALPVSDVWARQPRESGAGASTTRRSGAAEKLLREGMAALQAQDLKEAATKLGRAYELVPSPEALFQLARLALAEKRELDAQDLMQRYLEDPELESTSESFEQKEAARVLSRPRPPSASLNILGDRGTLIRIDQRLVGVLPLSRPLLIGPENHKLELERGGKRLEDEVRVPVGRLGEVRCNFETKVIVLNILLGVLVLDDYDGVGPSEQAALRKVVETTVRAERLAPLSREIAIDAAGEPEPGGCGDADRCAMQLAKKSEARFVLHVRVKRNLESWTLAMDLGDVEVGESAARAEQSCVRCDLDKATGTLDRLFHLVYMQGTSRSRGNLELNSAPSGAAVYLDGRYVGETPYAAAAWTGTRQIRLKKPGYKDELRQVVVKDGGTERLNWALSLVPAPMPAPVPRASSLAVSEHPQRPLWRLLGGGALLLAGTIPLGFGARALAIDGTAIDPPLSGRMLEQDLYDTRNLGIGLVVSGVVVMGTGVVLLSLPGSRHQVAAVRPRP